MGSNILVIEDDDDIRTILTDLLESEGYRVSIAANGEDALKNIDTQGEPDLILLDLMMPNMNGQEFIKKQRERSENAPKTPVVLMSAYDEMESRTNDLNASAYVKKPIEIEDLLSTVSKFLH